MDEKQFEAITRAVSQEVTRRGTIARLVGGLAAALTGTALVANGSVAKSKKRGKSRGKKRSPQRGSASNSQNRSVVRALSETCSSCSAPSAVQETDGNNPQCGFRFNVPDGATFPITEQYTHSAGDCTCVIEWTISLVDPSDPDGPTQLSFKPVDGQPVCSVSSVIVKGGNAYNSYTFDPPAFCAEGLVSPDNASGGPAAISHFDFCSDAVSCCSPLTCEDVVCTNGPICNGCGGTIDCPCDDSDACTTDSCDTEQKICVYTPIVCPDKPGCVNRGCQDGECQYDCRCKSCTIGYYSQNQCRWDTSLTLGCPADSAIGKKCYAKYGTTLKKLLTARGGDVICAQAAAASLNSLLGDNNCTGALDICSATNAQLSAANEGFGNETCPLRGCGNG